MENTKRYAIWVSTANTDVVESGYYRRRPDGPEYCRTPWRSDATPFDTLEEAKREIALRGFEDSTSVRPGAINAYVVEYF